MKKHILFSIIIYCFAFAYPIHSQIDVTNQYLTNYGFDTDFNYGTSTSGNIAGDVINNVSGWNKDMTATYTVAGTFAYGSGATFNGSSAIPNAGYNGSTGGALALTTGWGMSLKYVQNKTLLSGKYALLSAYYNVGTATAGSSLLGWEPSGENEAVISSVNSFPIGEWVIDSVEFVVLENLQGKIQIGFEAVEGLGSASNAKILVDYVKLVYYGIDKTELNAKISEAEALYADGNGIEAEALLELINTAKAISADMEANMSEVVNATNALSFGIFEYLLKNASETNPLNMTNHIVNPSFEESFTGWVNKGAVIQSNTSFPLKDGAFYVEKWVNMGSKIPNVSIEQQLTDIPNGKYKLTVAAGNIQQSTSGSTTNIGKAQTGLSLFAGYKSTAIDTIKDRSVDFYVLDNKTTIGLRSENATGNWFMCDNLRLSFLGFDINEIAALVTARITEANTLLVQKMQNTAKQALQNAISQAQQAIANNPLVSDDLSMAHTQLLESIAMATVSIEAYDYLQTAIDSALVVYADGSGNGADNLQNAISTALTSVENLDASRDAIYASASDVYKAIFAFYLANATGTPPTVVTHTNYARGATAAFGRSTVSNISTSNILERGFCWSTNPEPSILDNRTSKYFSSNGYVYHIENLQPATVYYMRAYALSKTYAVGYGEVIKVITLPKGTITFQLNNSVINAPGHYERIKSAMESAVEYWNNLTSIQGHHLSVNHHAGTPTAEASYGGYMQFGANASYQQTGTALHEMGHTIGVGQHSIWYGPTSPLRENGSRGKWLGDRANKVVHFLENNTNSIMNGDAVHMWPYGINGAHEDTGSEWLYIGNSLITQALGEDGLPPTGGFATPAYIFEHKDEVKYYIKNEAKSRGLETSFLLEDESGNLTYSPMNSSELLSNDKAAWYFNFIPATGFYHIRNAATGKFFTYKSTGLNGIGLASKTSPASNEYFQLMMARVNTEIGTGANTFTTRGYWIVYPEKKINPSCFVAGSNGTTSAATFNIANSATTQRWLILTGDEAVTFETAGSALPGINAKKTIFKMINCEGGILISSNDELFENINIYSIEGQIVRNINVSKDELFVPLKTGIYIVGNQKIVVF